MKARSLLVLGVVLVGCGGGGSSSSKRATFETLSTGSDGAFVKALSADGTLVLGGQQGIVSRPRLWASSGETSTFPSSTSLTFETVAAVTRDDRVFLGTALTLDGKSVPAFYRSETQIDALPIPDGATAGYAVGLSGDGTVALCTDAPQTTPFSPKPFLVKDGTATYLPLPEGATAASVQALSANGSTVVGAVGGKPTRWVNGGAPEALGTQNGLAFAVSRDGSTIVGLVVEDSTGDWKPFRWTAATGVQQIPTVAGSTYGEANGVSDDGKTVVLNYRTPGLNGQDGAYLWKEGV